MSAVFFACTIWTLISASGTVKVDHVDLISGEVTGKAEPGTPAYNKATNDTTKVVKRFTSKDWKTDRDGFHAITYKVKPIRINITVCAARI
ncbi:hypothetical protein [Peribacillus sp. YIM B13477]|uniref:hypothetical protein n=1 Tax=Peribacillus sp. YIM B13477 TaxID=3366300 RepID=UPI00366EF058